MLYQRFRLKTISIMNDSQIMRRYNFSYSTNNNVYPNVTWDMGGKTLTLSSVQEYGVGATNSLPATTFTYNGLHLVEANNGYQGRVAFSYDTQPWYELETIDEKAYSSTGCKYNKYGVGTTNFYEYPGEGDVDCDDWSPSPELNGKGYLPSPNDLYQPGAAYHLEATIKNIYIKNRRGYPITVRLGYNNGFQRVVLQEFVVNFRETRTLSAFATFPSNSTLIHLYLECTGDCQVGAKLELMPTRYRVRQKGYYDGVQAAPQVFQYRYDEPATNDELHSAAAATDHPYIEPTTEFRGHAMTQEVGPDGRVEWRFFHQDDTRKGRSSVDIVGSEEFQDDFSSGSANPSYWTVCGGTVSACWVADFRGDRAFDLQGGANWGHIHRQGNTVENGDMVLTQFLVNGSATQSMLILVSPSNMVWGAQVKADGTLGVIYQDAGGSHEGAFSPAITFKRDAWYVLLLAVDDQKFLARVWERDNPSNAGEFQFTMPTGLSWNFRLFSLNGTTWMDTYSEGRIYKLAENQYTTRTWATTSQPMGQIGPLPSDVGYFTGLGISWAEVQHAKSLDFEKDGEYKGMRTSFEYDDYGNQKRALDAEWDSTASAWRDYRLSVTGFYPNTNGVYLVGLPGFTNNYRCPANAFNGTCSSSYPSYPPAELVESSEWYLYDGHSGFSDLPTAGVLTGKRTALVKTSTETYYLDEDYVYDSWGNQEQTKAYKEPGTFSVRQTNQPLITTQAYDPVYHTFVLNETNALGQPTSFSYNYDLGLPVSMTGPNGVDTTITVGYDVFGRLNKVVRPEDTSDKPTLEATYYDPVGGATKFWIELQQLIEVKQIGGQDVARYARWRKVYNGLGLLIQAQTANAELQAGASDILVDYAYDAYGNVVTQTMPYANTPLGGGAQEAYRTPLVGQPYSRTDYDLLGRPLSVRAPDQALTQYRYYDWKTQAIDAKNKTTETVYDAWGRVKQVNPAMPPSVSYFYDAMDRLVGVSRGGVSTSIAYDMGGRKTSMSDPDMGAWSYTYDALGNLTRQTDARGQRICLYYDDGNRLVGKYFQVIDECPASPPYQVSFGYDDQTAGYYNIGQRTVMTDSTGVTHWLYDKRGQLVREERQVTGQGLFVTKWGYNSAGLAKLMKYPGGDDGEIGEQVDYTYKNQLTLNSVAGDFPYVQGAQYDAASRIVQRVLGNQAVINGYTYNPWTQQGGRLQQMTSGAPGDLTSLQKLQYTYDPVGNVMSIQDYKMGVDGQNPQTQTFAYDDLHRLISAQASNGLNGVGNYNESTASSLGYTYNSTTGNLSSKAGLSYTYGDPNHAHAVTSLSNGFSYQYDSNGNMTRRNLGSDVFNLAYDPENHLVQVSGTVTSTFGYDGDGKRVLSTEGITTTVYVGNYFEMSVSGGITSTVKYYYAGADRIAMRQNNGAVKWLLGDHLGSTSLVYDGTETIRQGYKAWGKRRFILGGEQLLTTFRYTGQREEISIGLYYYGVRWYDTTLGRFT